MVSTIVSSAFFHDYFDIQIRLPPKMSDSIHRESETSAESLKGSGELILLVDDEPSILRITSMVLVQQKYRVLCASDGSEALAVFGQQMDSIKLILTDINLPSINGIALIGAIKERKPNMVFIASTGQPDEAGVKQLEELGVTIFLTKPYDVPKLLRAIRDALEVRA
jgi:DNA-binding NtrC family response regulator